MGLGFRLGMGLGKELGIKNYGDLSNLNFFYFREALNEERMQRKAKVAERRERRLQEKNLFDNDVVERRKREDSSNDLSTEGDDFDYSYYYYGEGDDYEVYVGGKFWFVRGYPI